VVRIGPTRLCPTLLVAFPFSHICRYFYLNISFVTVRTSSRSSLSRLLRSYVRHKSPVHLYLSYSYRHSYLSPPACLVSSNTQIDLLYDCNAHIIHTPIRPSHCTNHLSTASMPWIAWHNLQGNYLDRYHPPVNQSFAICWSINNISFTSRQLSLAASTVSTTRMIPITCFSSTVTTNFSPSIYVPITFHHSHASISENDVSLPFSFNIENGGKLKKMGGKPSILEYLFSDSIRIDYFPILYLLYVLL